MHTISSNLYGLCLWRPRAAHKYNMFSKYVSGIFLYKDYVCGEFIFVANLYIGLPFQKYLYRGHLLSEWLFYILWPFNLLFVENKTAMARSGLWLGALLCLVALATATSKHCMSPPSWSAGGVSPMKIHRGNVTVVALLQASWSFCLVQAQL